MNSLARFMSQTSGGVLSGSGHFTGEERVWANV
jgi:hypothetical protein